MGILEEILHTLKDLKNELEKISLNNSKIQQKEKEEVWQRKDLEKFIGLKYANVKKLTSDPNFPKFYVGNTECYVKTQVIKYLKDLAQKNKYNKQPATKENKKSLLYSIK